MSIKTAILIAFTIALGIPRPAASSDPGTPDRGGPNEPSQVAGPEAGEVAIEIVSTKIQNSYEYRLFGRTQTIRAEGDRTFFIVEVEAHNPAERWEKFSSLSFVIEDEKGEAVKSILWGVGITVIDPNLPYGSFNNSIQTREGETYVKYRGRTTPQLSCVEWNLGPGRTHRETLVFVVPTNTRHPRLKIETTW